MPTPRRSAALLVALSAWTGLAIQIYASYQTSPSALAAIWAMLAYFTILSNLLTAFVATAITINRTPLRVPWVAAGTMLSMLLVGTVYFLLLRDIPITGTAANVFLHAITPVLLLIFWIAFEPRGQLRPWHVALWAVYPLAYLAYAMARGSITGRFAYPFLDAGRFGWDTALRNAFFVALGFLAAGAAMVWIDQTIARRRRLPGTLPWRS